MYQHGSCGMPVKRGTKSGKNYQVLRVMGSSAEDGMTALVVGHAPTPLE